MVSGSQDMTNQHVASLNAEGLKQLFLSGTKYIEGNVDAINSLNVFPVPDGDTGINMLLTLQAANDSVATSLPQETVGSLIESLAKGALLGARGNSGVIFSQFIKGMANGLSGCKECHGSNLQSALSHAADAGYLAVGTPVEGTMLSVMKAAATAAKNTKGDLVDVLRNAYESSVFALARTPEQLPILKEAGVVDAGGQGLVAFFAGALTFVGSEQVNFEISAATGSNSLNPTAINTDFLEHTEDEMYGYCTQFVIHGSEFNPSKIRSEVMHIANSTVVIGDDKLLRVHAHTYNPGELLNLGTQKGNLDQITIQNMDLQYAEFLEKHDKASLEADKIAFISHYRPSMFCGKGSMTERLIERNQRRLFSTCIEYTGNSNHQLVVLTKSRNSDDQEAERLYYVNLSGQKPLRFVTPDKAERELDSYHAGLSVALIVHPGSTLGFELFSAGQKVITGASADSDLIDAWGMSEYLKALPSFTKLSSDQEMRDFGDLADKLIEMRTEEYLERTAEARSLLMSIPSDTSPHIRVRKVIEEILDRA